MAAHTLTPQDIYDAIAAMEREDREFEGQAVARTTEFLASVPEGLLRSEALTAAERSFLVTYAHCIGRVIVNPVDARDMVAEVERLVAKHQRWVA